jgi:hypothetical protein
MGEVGIDEMADAAQVMGETLAEMGQPADAGAAAAVVRAAYDAALSTAAR